MLKEQKSTKEDDEKDQRIAQLEAQLQREKDLQSTREAFSEDGLTIPDSVLNMVVSTNQQTTVDNIGAIKSFVNAIRDYVGLLHAQTGNLLPVYLKQTFPKLRTQSSGFKPLKTTCLYTNKGGIIHG